MTCDYFYFPEIAFQVRRSLKSYIIVGNTMEAISPDMIRFVKIIRKTIKKGMRGHLLMKTGIKYSDLRDIRHELNTLPDCHHVGGIMKRGKAGIFIDVSHHFFIDDDRIAVFVTTMNNPMTDCAEFCQILEHALI
jgi:hypothetical protein